MKYSRTSYIAEYTEERTSRHPMLVHGAGIITIAAACNSAANALCLALTMLILCVIMAAVYLFEREEYIQPMRTIVYFVPSAIGVFLCGLGINALFPEIISDLGAYLPLLAADAIVLARLEEDAPFVPVTQALPEALSLWWLYAVMALPIGIVREILANGSIFGYALSFGGEIDAAKLTFFGFIMSGFGLALVQKMNNGKELK